MLDATCQQIVFSILMVIVAVCMIALCIGEWLRNRRRG